MSIVPCGRARTYLMSTLALRQDRATRRDRLLLDYNFECECARCEAEAALEDEALSDEAHSDEAHTEERGPLTARPRGAEMHPGSSQRLVLLYWLSCGMLGAHNGFWSWR